MFFNAFAANPNTINWNIGNATQMNGMFNGSGLTNANYGVFLNMADATSNQMNVIFGASNSEYPASSATARANLVANGWTITDSGSE